MLITRFVVWMFPISLILAASVVSGQNYPNKPIRLVTTEPGSGNDLIARLITPGLTDSFGQQVVVDNHGGASGAIAAQIVAKALPDGYTLLSYGSPLWIVTLIRDNVPYDPVKDFFPITLAASSPNILVVHPSVTASSVKELIALAKAKPGQLNYASGETGSSNHMAAELFKSMAGVNIVRISFKGTGPGLIALIGGQMQLMFPNAGAAAAHVKSGRLRALAVASLEPSNLVPGLPTVAASGLPGYESASPFGMFVPAKTSQILISRLNLEIVRVLRRVDVKEKLFNAGVEVIGSSPDQLTVAIKSDLARLGKVIKDVGIREE